MDHIATIKQWWCGAGKRWWAWLRRNGAMPLLLFLAVLRVGDPLTCITHCRVWLQQDLSRTSHHPQNIALLDDTGPQPNHLRPVIMAKLFVCFVDPKHGAPDEVPYAPSSTPYHEHLASLATMAFLVIVLLIQHTPRFSPYAAPQLTLRPPLRPPIPIVA